MRVSRPNTATQPLLQSETPLLAAPATFQVNETSEGNQFAFNYTVTANVCLCRQDGAGEALGGHEVARNRSITLHFVLLLFEMFPGLPPPLPPSHTHTAHAPNECYSHPIPPNTPLLLARRPTHATVPYSPSQICH
jgi:hypothetical protein